MKFGFRGGFLRLNFCGCRLIEGPIFDGSGVFLFRRVEGFRRVRPLICGGLIGGGSGVPGMGTSLGSRVVQPTF